MSAPQMRYLYGTVVGYSGFAGTLSSLFVVPDGSQTYLNADWVPGYYPDPDNVPDRVRMVSFADRSNPVVISSLLSASTSQYFALAGGMSAVSGRIPATLWRNGRVNFGGQVQKSSAWPAGDVIGTIYAKHRSGNYNLAAPTSNGLASIQLTSAGVLTLLGITSTAAAWIGFDGIDYPR